MTKQKEHKVPKAGNRCPRCHRPAPRMDGIPCMLCCPGGPSKLTITDTKTGVTHWYRSRCKPEVLLAGTPISELNVGASVPVTCVDCIAHEGDNTVWLDTETSMKFGVGRAGVDSFSSWMRGKTDHA